MRISLSFCEGVLRVWNTVESINNRFLRIAVNKLGANQAPLKPQGPLKPVPQLLQQPGPQAPERPAQQVISPQPGLQVLNSSSVQNPTFFSPSGPVTTAVATTAIAAHKQQVSYIPQDDTPLMRAIAQAREFGAPEAWQFPVILPPPIPAIPVAQNHPQPADPAQQAADPATPQDLQPENQVPQPENQAPQANNQPPQLPAAMAQPVPGIFTVQAAVQPDPLHPGQVQLCPATWESFSFKFLKDFKASVKQYSTNSHFVRSTLKALAEGKHLVPYDWKILAKSVLSKSQYLQFRTWWVNAVQECIRLNQGSNPPVNVMADQLLGMGQWAGIRNQAILNDEVIEQLRKCCLDAWDKIQNDGKVCRSFTAVTQGQQEPYPDFIARLQDVTEKAIADSHGQQLVVELMAYEQTNADCQAAICPIKGKIPPEGDVLFSYVKVCEGMGGTLHTAMVMAQAMATVRMPG
ncbi:endogenous retrovirus group K member 113 Gag polyprotein-like [Symphalangus syndactylus]|uniref:endogenous retrovirus group K member 113 Gag polyprotein-like n=1 Tax=Symphalangus syndactylus TaxID=9590 RepID=UPI0030069D86